MIDRQKETNLMLQRPTGMDLNFKSFTLTLSALGFRRIIISGGEVLKISNKQSHSFDFTFWLKVFRLLCKN